MVTSQRPRTGERHVTPLESTRRGAHRARPGALAAALPMVAVVVVVVIAIFAMSQIFDSTGSPDDGRNVADSPTPSTSARPSNQPAQSSAPAPSPSPSQPDQGAAPGVNKQAPLLVLNNTSTTGLGKRAAAKLKAAGWTVKPVGNLTPRNQITTTTVFYASDQDEATAQAVVDSLGIGAISQSQLQAKKGITVVLAGDFTP